MPFPVSDAFSADVVDWAEANIILPDTSARSGPLRLYGWQKQILRDFVDPACGAWP